MPITVVTDPGVVVVSSEDDEDIRLVIEEQLTKVAIEAPTPIRVSTPEVGLQGAAGPSGLTVFETFHTWAIQGIINIAAGQTDYIPPMFVFAAPGQTITLSAVKHRIRAGTSAQVKLQRNGVDVPGYDNIMVTQATTVTDAAEVALVEGDELALVVVGTSGAPMNMSFTVVLTHSG